MKIRTKLALLFTLITATLLLSFILIIFYSSKIDREKEFYTVLEKEAITKANIFFNAKIDVETLQNIYKNNRQYINEVEVAIYDTNFNLLYHDAVEIDIVKESKAMIDSINQIDRIRFYQNDWQVVGIKFHYQNKNYIVTAAAVDRYGYNKLDNLLSNSMFSFVIAIIFIYWAGLLFSKRVFQPVKTMVAQVQQISTKHLDLRLAHDNTKDELAELADTFNRMLDRLENSFEAQKDFVSNISHELRTPLSNIITELDWSVAKERSPGEYRSTIQNALQDAQLLARLSASLLDLAKVNYDSSEITFKKTRIDELLLDACRQVQQTDKAYKIALHFEEDIDIEEDIQIYANAYLLQLAFTNLMENACKFSVDHQVTVQISANTERLRINFIDHGVGIPEEDIPHLFHPFFRGLNQQYATGNGIGLSLTKKIITLHRGTISLSSVINVGSIFRIDLPKKEEKPSF